MGIEIAEAKFLRSYLRAGYSCRDTLTLGKQDNWLTDREMLDIFGKTGCPFEMHGAENVDVLDLAPGRHVTWIADLNKPNQMANKYDLIYDGGTLEHCFRFEQALQNVLNMLKLGGSLLLATPTSNYSGHGFWQVSPEYFYGLDRASTTLSVRDMWLVELAPRIRYYRVSDPSIKRRRSDFVSRWPCMLYVWLTKDTANLIDVGALATIQSDYMAQITGNATREQTGYIDRWSHPKWRKWKLVARTVAPGLAGWLQRWRFGRLPLSKNPCFTRINP